MAAATSRTLSHYYHCFTSFPAFPSLPLKGNKTGHSETVHTMTGPNVAGHGQQRGCDPPVLLPNPELAALLVLCPYPCACIWMYRGPLCAFMHVSMYCTHVNVSNASHVLYPAFLNVLHTHECKYHVCSCGISCSNVSVQCCVGIMFHTSTYVLYFAYMQHYSTHMSGVVVLQMCAYYVCCTLHTHMLVCGC